MRDTVPVASGLEYRSRLDLDVFAHPLQLVTECCLSIYGSAQKLIGILSAKCPVFMGLLQTVYAKLFLYDPYAQLNTS